MLPLSLFIIAFALSSSSLFSSILSSSSPSSPFPYSSDDSVSPFSETPLKRITIGTEIFEHGTYENYLEKMFSFTPEELDRCYFKSRTKNSKTQKYALYPFLNILVYYAKDDRILEYFASSGMNINSVCKGLGGELFSPLDIAILTRKSSFVRILIKNGANPELPNSNPALITAIMDGNLEIVKILIDEFNLNPNVRSIKGESAIFLAVENSWLKITKYLASLPNMIQIDSPAKFSQEDELSTSSGVSRDSLVSPLTFAAQRSRGRTISSPHLAEYVAALSKPQAQKISCNDVYAFEEDSEEEEFHSLDQKPFSPILPIKSNTRVSSIDSIRVSSILSSKAFTEREKLNRFNSSLSTNGGCGSSSLSAPALPNVSSAASSLPLLSSLMTEHAAPIHSEAIDYDKVRNFSVDDTHDIPPPPTTTPPPLAPKRRGFLKLFENVGCMSSSAITPSYGGFFEFSPKEEEEEDSF